MKNQDIKQFRRDLFADRVTSLFLTLIGNGKVQVRVYFDFEPSVNFVFDSMREAYDLLKLRCKGVYMQVISRRKHGRIVIEKEFGVCDRYEVVPYAYEYII